MNKLKSYLGILWIIAGIGLVGFVGYLSVNQISAKPTADSYIQWAVFFFLSIPVSAGLVLFGWYAWKGEFDRLPINSSELEKKNEY